MIWNHIYKVNTGWEEILIYNIGFILNYMCMCVQTVYILTWSLDVPNLLAISIFSMILKLVYFQRSSPSSMFFWVFLSSGKVPITCLIKKLFDTTNTCISILVKGQNYVTFIKSLIQDFWYTLYYFWQSFYMYMHWPVTSGVEAGDVWNVSDQGVL